MCGVKTVAAELVSVGYARYSTDKQTKNSIAYQKEAILDFCRGRGLPLRRFFVDEGATGTNLDRQGLQDLISAAKRREFNAVIVYDISRGSRDVGDWFTLRSMLAELGVRLIAVKQELGDITNPSDFIKEALEVSIAQYEVLQTRSKSIAGTAERAKQGVFLGGTPPLGYNIVDQEYVINEREARWVRTIFRMYADGASYNQILDAIPEARGKRGRPLGKNSLYSILSNPRYDGTYIWNERIVKRFGHWAGGKPNPDKVTIEAAIPAIVDAETMQKVEKRMADNKHKGRNTAKREYLLSGLIECEVCGAAYCGRTTTNNNGYESSSYHCGNKYRTRRCSAKNVNAAMLEKAVVDSVNEYLKSADFRVKAECIADQLNHWSPDLRAEKRELSDIEQKLRNGLKAILDGMYFPELQQEMDRLRSRKLELEDIITRSQSGLGNADVGKIERVFLQSVEDLRNGNARRALVAMVPKIIAHANGDFTVSVGVSVTGCGGAQHVVYTTYTFKVA